MLFVPAPHPPEFRRRAVDLARSRVQPIAAIANELSISESCLRNWLAQDDADAAARIRRGCPASAATAAARSADRHTRPVPPPAGTTAGRRRAAEGVAPTKLSIESAPGSDGGRAGPGRGSRCSRDQFPRSIRLVGTAVLFL